MLLEEVETTIASDCTAVADGRLVADSRASPVTANVRATSDVEVRASPTLRRFSSSRALKLELRVCVASLLAAPAWRGTEPPARSTGKCGEWGPAGSKVAGELEGWMASALGRRLALDIE